VQESEARYIKHEFKIVNHKPLTLRCVYCEHGFEPKYIASTEWHEGKLATKTYHDARSHWVKKIKPENLIIFDTAAAAQAMGFKANHIVGESGKK
jgi:hypothetical protein